MFLHLEIKGLNLCIEVGIMFLDLGIKDLDLCFEVGSKSLNLRFEVGSKGLNLCSETVELPAYRIKPPVYAIAKRFNLGGHLRSYCCKLRFCCQGLNMVGVVNRGVMVTRKRGAVVAIRGIVTDRTYRAVNGFIIEAE